MCLDVIGEKPPTISPPSRGVMLLIAAPARNTASPAAPALTVSRNHVQRATADVISRAQNISYLRDRLAFVELPTAYQTPAESGRASLLEAVRKLGASEILRPWGGLPRPSFCPDGL